MTAAATGKKRVEIRMYNVGFGDCFLIRIPTKKGAKRMLVDCGYHSQGKGKFSDAELLTQIAKDLNGEGLDVVVATHRHQDHISGFGETEAWKKIGVEEVWLPFTARVGASSEEPSLALWDSLMERAQDLVDGNGALTAMALGALGARSPEELDAAAFMIWNARTNAPGIENLRKGMKRADGKAAKRRYLPSSGEDVPFEFTTDALPGVTVHVLGPARDKKYRSKRKVPSDWGFATSDAGGGLAPAPSPFGPEWRIPEKSLPARLPFQPKSLEAIRRFNDDLLAAAAAVDGFLNGESLVLVLEIGNARLLLPGDAEVGSWMKILEDSNATSIAAGATFLKCGHHGSHNATPLVFLEDHLAAKTPVMMSTQAGPGQYRRGIPRPEIIATLSSRHMSLARSDAPMSKKQGPFTPGTGGRWIDASIPC